MRFKHAQNRRIALQTRIAPPKDRRETLGMPSQQIEKTQHSPDRSAKSAPNEPETQTEQGHSWTGSHLLLGERAALHQLLDLRVKATAAAVVYVHGLHTAAAAAVGD